MIRILFDALYKFKCPNALQQAKKMREAYGDKIDRVYRWRESGRENEMGAEIQLPCAVCPYRVSQEFKQEQELLKEFDLDITKNIKG